MEVLNLCYTLTHVSWLAVFFTENNVRLHYQKVWDSGSPRALLCGAYLHVIHFPGPVASRIQSTIDRFFSKSNIPDAQS